ncbi:hypothetical protein CEE37_00815 [candidate division LCP-89 bacterium B3_LCP]|uniref:histidine kinase n=1 Tax=candidate division LCP-89 bacterium B3_LCP TaxID=2012998 RepID=A0A532V4Y8_UNCL8|nr:MAG: hypothetical protein CEE37_00815 [candidate division LCP-89 bacterium B3_LCP]
MVSDEPINPYNAPNPRQRPRSDFDSKIAVLVESFEKRIRKLRSHINELEVRIGDLQTAKENDRASFDEFLGLQELSEMIRATSDPEKVVEALFQIVQKYIAYDQIGVYLFDVRNGELEPLGSAPAKLTQAAQSQYDEGILDWVVSERRPVVIPWTESFGRDADYMRKHLIVVPLIVGDHPTGVALLATSKEPDDFTPQELKILFFAISHAAVAIQNSLTAKEVLKTKEFLSSLLENAGDIIFSIDMNDRFSYLNPGIEDLGFQKDELINQHFRTVFKRPDTGRRIQSTLHHGSKQVFDLEFSSGVARNQRFTISLVPIKDRDGKTTGALGIMRNVTEINRLQRKLLESERLAAYTQTVITLNHEINNPLTTVLGNVYLLEKESAEIDYPNFAKRLKVIQDNCMRIQQVIKKLERIDELKTVSYLGDTKMVDLDDDKDESK